MNAPNLEYAMSARNRKRRPQFERLETRQLLANLTELEHMPPTQLDTDAVLGPALYATQSRPDAINAAQTQLLPDEVRSNISVGFWEGESVGSGIAVRVTRGSGAVALGSTDSNGLAVLEYRPVGTFRATADFTREGVRYHGHLDFTGRVSAPIWVQQVVVRPSDTPVNGKNSITVTVKEADGREVISGAVVHLLDASGETLQAYRSNTNGRVSFWELGDQQYTIRVCDSEGNGCSTDLTRVFSETRTRERWTPIVRMGASQLSRTLFVSGQRSQYLGSDPGCRPSTTETDGVGCGTDFRNDEPVSELSSGGQDAVQAARRLTPAQLLDQLKTGMAPGGPLATEVVAPLFTNWARPIPAADYARGVTKETSSLVQRGGRNITAPVLRHGEDSLLSEAVQSTQQFQTYARKIAGGFRSSVAAQAVAGQINLDLIELDELLEGRPGFGPGLSAEAIRNWWRSPSVLSRIIGGTQGAAARIENFQLGVQSGTVRPNSLVGYTADLVIVLADDFGLDNSDMRHADIGELIDQEGATGLRAQWILQHDRKVGKPFVNEIVVRVPIEGSFRMPYGYDRISDQTRRIAKTVAVSGGSVTLARNGRAHFVPTGGIPRSAYGGAQRVEQLVGVRGGVVTRFDGGGAYFSPSGLNLGGGGGTLHGYVGGLRVEEIVSVNGGVVTRFSDGSAYFSPDGLNLGGGGNSRTAYVGSRRVEQIVSVAGGVVARFNNGDAYFSPNGLNLAGGGDTVRAYAGSQRVAEIVSVNGGVLSRFSGGGAYLSPNGLNLGGGGSTLRAYQGSQRVQQIASVNGGVVARFSGGGAYFSRDGLNLGGGGATRLAYTGTQRVEEMAYVNGGLVTRFSGGGAYFSRSGLNLGGGGTTVRANAGTLRVESIRSLNDGVLTRFRGGEIYFSPDGFNLGGGGRTVRWS